MEAQNNYISLAGTVEELTALLDKHAKAMKINAEMVSKYGKAVSSISLPSEFVSNLQAITDANNKMVASNAKVVDSTKKVDQARKREVEDYQRRKRAFDNEIKQEERLRAAKDRKIQKVLEENRAYNRLQNDWRRAQKTLQDLLASERSSTEQIRKATIEFDKFDKKIRQVDASTKNYSKNVGNYPMLNGIGNLTSQLSGALGWAGAISTAVNLGKAIYATTRELESFHMAMKAGAGDEVIYAKNLDFLKRITEQYGLELMSTSQAYNKFYVASKDKLSIKEIQQVFEDVSKASATMGLSIYEQEGIFKALEQMMSKGTVQAEELRGQLGDRLPGAFGIMAKSMKVSEEELGKLMKDGKVMADEVLPEFAKQLVIAYGADKVEKIETVTAAENRFKNAWTEAVESMSSGNGVISNSIKGFYDLSTSILNAVTSKKGLIDEVKNEQTELNFLILKITASNTSNEERARLIETLKKSYPGFIKFIENEDFTNESLINTLKRVNEEYRNRIVLQKQVDVVEQLREKRDKLQSTSASSRLELFKKLVEINEKYKLGLEGQIKLENAEEIAGKVQYAARKNISILEQARIRKLKKDVDSFAESAERINKEAEKEQKLQESIQKSMGIQTEQQRKQISSIEEYNKKLDESLEKARKLGGIAGKDYKSDDLDGIERFIKSRSKKDEGLSDKELKKLQRERDKAAKEELKNLKELTKAEYDLAKAKLEGEKEAAKSAENNDLYVIKSVELATLKYNHEVKMADLEIENEKTKNVKKLALAAEYAAEVQKIENEGGKEDQKRDEKREKDILKANGRLYKLEEEKWQNIAKIAKKYRTSQYDAEQFSLQLEEIGMSTQGLEYWDNQKKQLDSWYKYQKDIHAKNSEELIAIDNEYALKNAEIQKKQKESLKEFLNGFTSLDQFGLGSLDMIFNGQFESIIAGAETMSEKVAAALGFIGNVAKDMFATMTANSDKYFENQFNQLEKEKEIALKYAGDNKAGQEAIEAQYTERKKQLQRQQAKQEKQMAIFNAVINIAQGVTAALAQAPPYSFILAALVGALGAVQIASISSQPLPQFWKGTDNAPEGWAIVDELRPEVHTDKHGNIKSTGSKGGANLRYLESGDKIYKSHDAFFREINSQIMFGGGMSIEKHNEINFDYNKIDEIFGKHLDNLKQTNVSIDRNGVNVWMSNGRNRTVVKNNRFSR